MSAFSMPMFGVRGTRNRVVERGYRRLIPDRQTPLANLLLATMAQIYPQDRGTNYAIQQGREAARAFAAMLEGEKK